MRLGQKFYRSEVTSAILPARRAIYNAAPIGPDDRNQDTKSGKIKLKYGKLRENIKKRKARNYSDKSKSAYISTGDAFWGFFLEFGTRYIPATGWFQKPLKA